MLNLDKEYYICKFQQLFAVLFESQEQFEGRQKVWKCEESQRGTAGSPFWRRLSYEYFSQVTLRAWATEVAGQNVHHIRQL